MVSTQNAGSTNKRKRYLVRTDEGTPFAPSGLLPAIGLLIVFLFGVTAFAYAWIQGSARTSAQDALVASSADWADVEVSGQWVTLKGIAPSNAASRAAERAVREATNRTPFGFMARPVTRVFNNLVVTNGQRPAPETVSEPEIVEADHDWSYTLDRSVLELSGEVPNKVTRDAVISAAELRIAPPRVTAIRDRLRVTGRPVQSGFTETALRGVNTLSRCDTGITSFTKNVFALSCEAQASAASEIELLANAPLTYGKLGRIDVYTQEAAETCNEAMLDLLSTTRIEFETSSSQIDSASAALLGRVASAAATCPGTLRVEGHTDNSGRSNLNDRLSTRRAQAVRRALIDRGVASGRLTAQGYGASRPIADNSTPAGRARNRRIEIKVASGRN